MFFFLHVDGALIEYFFYIIKKRRRKKVWVITQSCSIINVPSSKTPQVAPGTLSQQVVNSKLWKASAKWHIWACSIFVHLENGVCVFICQSAVGKIAWSFCDFFRNIVNYADISEMQNVTLPSAYFIRKCHKIKCKMPYYFCEFLSWPFD